MKALRRLAFTDGGPRVRADRIRRDRPHLRVGDGLRRQLAAMLWRVAPCAPESDRRHRVRRIGVRGDLCVAVGVLVLVALVKRAEPGVSGKGGVLRGALASAGLVVLQALLGMVTVRVGQRALGYSRALLNSTLVLAALAATVLRAGGLGGALASGAAPSSTQARHAEHSRAQRSRSSPCSSAGLPRKSREPTVRAPDSRCAAARFCRRFRRSTCSLRHRLLAFLLFLHVLGLMTAFTARGEAPAVIRTVRVAFALTVPAARDRRRDGRDASAAGDALAARGGRDRHLAHALRARMARALSERRPHGRGGARGGSGDCGASRVARGRRSGVVATAAVTERSTRSCAIW